MADTIWQVIERLGPANLVMRKSHALVPLVQLLMVLMTILGVAAWAGSDEVVWFAVALIGVGVLTYVGGFAFFMVKDPDALRSESYKLKKMQIERGLIGDSTQGLHQVSTDDSAPALPVSSVSASSPAESDAVIPGVEAEDE